MVLAVGSTTEAVAKDMPEFFGHIYCSKIALITARIIYNLNTAVFVPLNKQNRELQWVKFLIFFLFWNKRMLKKAKSHYNKEAGSVDIKSRQITYL